MIEALETKHFVSATGEYLGGFGGVRRTTETPDPETGEPVIEITEEWPAVEPGAVEVPAPPDTPLARWAGGKWVAHAPAVIAAEKLKQASEQIKARPEIAALVEALAARLSIAPEVLEAEVASNLAARG
jgi:hypothetical protein